MSLLVGSALEKPPLIDEAITYFFFIYMDHEGEQRKVLQIAVILMLLCVMA